jgi:KRAB domain-containing zinc finger protein
MCKLCNKRFAQLPHLKKHMLCVHNTDRPYYCEVCETFFKVKVTYQEHAAQSHPGRVPSL